MSVEVPRENLREYGVTLEQIAGSIRQASVEVPAGNLETDAGDILLRTAERRDSSEEFGSVVLASRPDGTRLRVSDLATIEDGFADDDSSAYFNGEPAVKIRVYRVGNETPLEISGAVHEYVEELRQRLPEGVGAAVWADTAELYKGRVDLLMRNAKLGLLLVLLVLGMFLEPRLAFWVTLGIPISFAGSLMFLPSSDVSINMISLFAFIVTLGMVVDDAIIVESIYKYREQGLTRLTAAVQGDRRFCLLLHCHHLRRVLTHALCSGHHGEVLPRNPHRRHPRLGDEPHRVTADSPGSPLAQDALAAPDYPYAIHPRDEAHAGRAGWGLA